MGKPTIMASRPEAIDRLCAGIKLGMYLDIACAYAGIDYTTMRSWLIRGEKLHYGQYYEVAQRIKEAEADAVSTWLGHIDKAIELGTWQAAAWKLERRYPQHYARRMVTEGERTQGQQVQFTFVIASPRELERLPRPGMQKAKQIPLHTMPNERAQEGEYTEVDSAGET